MRGGRHTPAWRQSRVATSILRLLVGAGLALLLLAPAFAVTVTTANAAERPEPDRLGLHSELGVGLGHPAAAASLAVVAKQPTQTTDGGHEIPVEGGRIKDWQAMLVAGGGASLLMFLFGKVRRK